MTTFFDNLNTMHDTVKNKKCSSQKHPLAKVSQIWLDYVCIAYGSGPIVVIDVWGN